MPEPSDPLSEVPPPGVIPASALSPRGGPDPAHRRGCHDSDATVKALGRLSEALEAVEHARGLLYGFHRLTGTADLALGEAVDLLRDAGHGELAEDINQRIVGRNVISGRWTFQLVEDYDDGYYAEFKAAEKQARDILVEGKRHLFEAEMKEDRRTHGRAHHEALPQEVRPQEVPPPATPETPLSGRLGRAVRPTGERHWKGSQDS